MAASRFMEVTDKEISEIKINLVPKNPKTCGKNTKTIISPQSRWFHGGRQPIVPRPLSTPISRFCIYYIVSDLYMSLHAFHLGQVISTVLG
jgi:hypothetical protein